jgi:hypothetical protein
MPNNRHWLDILKDSEGPIICLRVFRVIETEPFGQKIALHLQLADLAVEFIDLGFVLFFGFVTFLKDLGGAFHQGALPGVDHGGVNAKASRQFGHCFIIVKAARATLALNSAL